MEGSQGFLGQFVDCPLERSNMYIPKELIVLDLETTGSQPVKDEIIEIGAVKAINGEIVDTFNVLIQPRSEIPDYITMLTGIDNSMVANSPYIEEVMPKFLDFCQDYVIVGHNVALFDYRMLKVKANKQGYVFEKHAIDTLILARKFLPDLPSRRLGDLCEYYNINLSSAHRAFHDAKATYELLMHLIKDYYDEAPELFAPRKMAWKVPKQSPITSRQKSFLNYLLTTHNIILKEDINKLSKSEASRRIDTIIREHGREG